MLEMNFRKPRKAFAMILAGASLSAMTAGAAGAQTQPASPGDQPTATPAAAPAPQAQDGGDAAAAPEIVVTGFRRSLDAALSLKRDSVAAVDAIVAEDIAKFPDQNLAESLQRIPGISIDRDGGEGRAITVRGLGSDFTTVRLNGLETVATSTNGESHNTSRGFDFDVFASELFSSLVVHKTAEASLDEGSLGAVVDLNTGNPLAGKSGLTAIVSAKGAYNTLSKDMGPRITGLLAWKSPDGRFGASVSGAYSATNTLELGNNTVGWEQAKFNSVNGTPCFTTSQAGGKYVPSPDCDKVALAFVPRIPRYMIVDHNRKRLGLTGSVQWKPTDRTEIELDGLYSTFKEIRDQQPAEVLFRGDERSMDITNYKIDGNGNLVSATVNNAWVRTEHYYRESKTTFHQIDGHIKQEFSDKFRVTLLGGLSESIANIPKETTIMFDDRDANGYSYDYSNMNHPVLNFGSDMTNPAKFQLSEIRDRPSRVDNKFKTGQLAMEWDAAPGFKIQAGGMYRRFDFETRSYQRDTLVCPNVAGGTDVVLGTITCSPSNVFGPNAVYGFPVTSDLTQSVTLGNAGQPAGTTTQWIMADIGKAGAYTHLYQRPALISQSASSNVSEQTSGGYLQFSMKGSLLGLDYAANAGTRFVHTAQSSSGYVNGSIVTVDRGYDDWLPSFNLALYPAHNVIVRGAIARVITRPPLSTLSPGGSVDSFNFGVSFGNPLLNPYRATNFDLSFEYYFAPQSLFSIALFRKDVASFTQGRTIIGTYASTGLPTSILSPGSPAAQNPEAQLWTIKTTVNGTGAKLQGVEVLVQAPFKFLPGFLSNFGGIANATFISSNADYPVTSPVVALGVPQLTPTITQPLFGVSRRSFNGTLYYEDKKFSARASLSYRGGFLTSSGSNGNVFAGTQSTLNLDASLRYHFTKRLEVSLEGTNLTDQYQINYDDIDAQRDDSVTHYGRTIQLGVRFSL